MVFSILSSVGLLYYGIFLFCDVMLLFFSVESGIKWIFRLFGSCLVKVK